MIRKELLDVIKDMSSKYTKAFLARNESLMLTQDVTDAFESGFLYGFLQSECFRYVMYDKEDKKDD